MTSLSEFENYFKATYIVGQNLVQDLLSRLFAKAKPYSYEESIRNITSALNGLKILKTKKLERNISDIQLEMILSQCLLNSDQAEYFREWVKERSNTVLSSTLLEPADEEEPPVNFNKTICDEVDAGAMEVKRDFLARFLVRKQMELSEILASRRTRSFAKKEGGNSKFVKFRDKTFQMVECEDEDQVTGEILDENVFLSAVKKEGSGRNKGPCPIK